MLILKAIALAATLFTATPAANACITSVVKFKFEEVTFTMGDSEKPGNVLGKTKDGRKILMVNDTTVSIDGVLYYIALPRGGCTGSIFKR